MQLRARRNSADYAQAHFGKAEMVEDRYKVLDIAIEASRAKEGIALEFGVYHGMSINYIGKRFKGRVYGFDSFEGLPEFWREGFDKGTFKVESLPVVPKNVTLVKGWFSATVSEFIQTSSAAISLIHIDCDLYSSTVTVLDALNERILKGTVIVFDEYYNYPGWENGEFLAFQQFCQKYNRSYHYLAYNGLHEQVAVVVD
jgi:predicted O-methyltransferase YrrM